MALDQAQQTTVIALFLKGGKQKVGVDAAVVSADDPTSKVWPGS
jgi:hypothetical protein